MMNEDDWGKPLSSVFPTGKCDETYILRLVLSMLLGIENDLFIKSTKTNSNMQPSSSSSSSSYDNDKNSFTEYSIYESNFELSLCAYSISLSTLSGKALQTMLRWFSHLGSLLLPIRETLHNQQLLLKIKNLGKESQLNVCIDTLASIDVKLRLIYAQNFTVSSKLSCGKDKQLLLPSEELPNTIFSLGATNESLLSLSQLLTSVSPSSNINVHERVISGNSNDINVSSLLGLYRTTRPWLRTAQTVCVWIRCLLLECAHHSSESVLTSDHNYSHDLLLKQVEQHTIWADLTTLPSTFPSTQSGNSSRSEHILTQSPQREKHLSLRIPTYHLVTRAFFHTIYNHLLSARLLSLQHTSTSYNSTIDTRKVESSIGGQLITELYEINAVICGSSVDPLDSVSSTRLHNAPLSLHDKEKQRLAVNQVMRFHLDTSLAPYKYLNSHFIFEHFPGRHSYQSSKLSGLKTAIDLLLTPTSHPQLIPESRQLLSQHSGRYTRVLVEGDNPKPFVHPTVLLLNTASSSFSPSSTTGTAINKKNNLMNARYNYKPININYNNNSMSLAHSIVHTLYPPSSLLFLTVERPLRAYMHNCEHAYIQNVYRQGQLQACQLLLNQIYCLSDPTVFAPLSGLLLAGTHYVPMTPLYSISDKGTDARIGSSKAILPSSSSSTSSEKNINDNAASNTTINKSATTNTTRQRRSIFDYYVYKSGSTKKVSSPSAQSPRTSSSTSVSVDPTDQLDSNLLWTPLISLSDSIATTQSIGRLVRRLNQSLTTQILQVIANVDINAHTPCCQLLSSSPLSISTLSQTQTQTQQQADNQESLLIYELARTATIELKFRIPTSLLTESLLRSYTHTLRTLLPLSVLRTTALHLWKPILSHHTYCSRNAKLEKSSVTEQKIRNCYTAMSLLINSIGRLWSHYMSITQETILPQLKDQSMLQSVTELRAIQNRVSMQLCTLVDMCEEKVSKLILAGFQLLSSLRSIMVHDPNNAFNSVTIKSAEGDKMNIQQEQRWDKAALAADTFHSTLVTLARSVRSLEGNYIIYNERNKKYDNFHYNGNSSLSYANESRMYYDMVTSFVEALSSI